jgi:tRNA G37 N-methylase Trm5
MTKGSKTVESCSNEFFVKVSDKIHIFNLDARDFIRELMKDNKNSSLPLPSFSQVIMNLPASAVEFLGTSTFLFIPQHMTCDM